MCLTTHLTANSQHQFMAPLLETQARRLRNLLVLSPQRLDPLDVALALGSKGWSFVPLHVRSLREGQLGMDWDQGTFVDGPERQLVSRTTLLLFHRSLNEPFWK